MKIVARWFLLNLYVPGCELTPCGLLLEAQNKLWMKVREAIDCDAEMFQEIWSEMPNCLRDAFDGTSADENLQIIEGWSHTVRIAEEGTIEVVEPSATLAHLFRLHVLGLGVFRPADWISARDRLGISPVLLEAAHLLADENFDLSRTARIISRDQVSAGLLIQMANSCMYQSYFGPVNTLDRAIMRIGHESARSLLLGLAARRAFESKPEMRSLWNHAVEVAEECRILASSTRSIEPAEAALAGLMHDIGRLILVQIPGYEAEFSKLTSGSNARTVVDAERELCGVSHAEIGAALLQDWSFPPHLVTAVRLHHGPASAELSDLAKILYCAEAASAEHAVDSARIENYRATLASSSQPSSGAELRFLRFAASA